MTRQQKDVRKSHYIKKLLDMRDKGTLPSKPGLFVASVYHDDWCAMFKGGECNCNPDVGIREWGKARD